MAELLSLDDLNRLADSPPPPERGSGEGLLSLEQLQGMADMPAGAPGGGEPTSFGMEALKVIPSSIGQTAEFVMDAVEAAPVGVFPRAAAAGVEALKNRSVTDEEGRFSQFSGAVGDEFSKTFSLNDSGVPSLLTRGFEKGAGDRLREAAVKATIGDAVKRVPLPKDTPYRELKEGAISGIGIAAASAIPGGGLTSRMGKISAALSGLLGGGGRAAAEYADAGQGATALAEGGGALAGGLLPLLRSAPHLYKRAEDIVDVLYKRLLDKRGEPPRIIKEKILRFISNDLLVDPETAIPQIERALKEGDVGTTATVAAKYAPEEAARLAGAQKILPKSMGNAYNESQLAQQRIDQANQATQELATSQVRATVPGGVTEGARAPQAARQAQTVQGLRTRAAQRGQQGERLVEEAAGLDAAAAARVAGPEETAASRTLSAATDKGRGLTKARESRLWADAAKHTDSNMRTGAVKRAITEVLGAEPKATVGALRANASVKRVLNEIDELDDLTPVREVLEYKRQLAGEITAAVKRGDIPSGNIDRVVKNLTEAIDSRIMIKSRAPAVQRAIDASIDRFKFDTGLVGDLRKGVAKADAPEVAGDLVGKARGTGARIDDIADAEAAAVKAGGDPTAMTQATDDVLRAQFRKATLPERLDANPRAGQTWLNARKAALEGRPALVREFEQSIDELGRGKVLSKSAAAKQEASETLNKRAVVEGPSKKGKPTTPWGRFARHEDPVQAARTALNDKEPAELAARLVQVARNTGDPQDLKNLQSAYRDAFLDRALSDKNVLKASAGRQLDKERRALAAVMDPEDMAKLDSAIALVKRIDGGEKIPDADLINILGEANAGTIAAARVLGANLGGTIGNPLIAASIASKAARDTLETIPRAQAQKALLNYLVNPEKFTKEWRILQGKDTSLAQAKEAIDNIITPTAAATVTAAQEE